MDVTDWLRGLGLEQYAPAFQENNIGGDLLPSVTADDLKDLGVASVGHRRRLLEGIAALRAGSGATCERPAAPALVPERSQSSTQPDAERRQVTVMFCDLVGSTALASRLDPEDLREVIGRYHACVAQTVGRFEGFVAKYMGDGVLVYFGYPLAHEDDAEQAVRAGLALIDAVGELQAPQRLQVRIGIATGLVVVGDLIGAGSAQEQTIVGETPNLAARLQALADSGAMVIAESTRRQIGSLFEIHDLGPQSLKGFAEPQRAWRVLSENRALGRFEALRSRATPLVGRDEELDLLLRRWAQAKAGGGRMVLISAEPGVGKSRLAEALVERIADQPHIRLRYFCSPHHQDSALYPIIAQMERAAGFAREDSPETKVGKLQALLAAPAPPEDVALLAELHSLPSADIAPPLDVSPQRKKEKTFEALLRQIERLSSHQPVLMVFEDIHWIDPSSRELLDRTTERIANWPVLLVATFRPEFLPPWTGQSHVTMLALTRLDRHDTASMVERIAGRTELPPGIVQAIAERTDGVPLFIEELTKAVLESGPQVKSALEAVPYPALSVPATLHASLMARLDRLGAAAKDVAQKAAVVGRDFAYELLSLVADMPEPQLLQALDGLTSSGLLFVRGTPPQSIYIFKHALVQDAAYGTLLRGRRHELHRRIAEALESRFPEAVEAQPELLAHHFTEAGLTERGVAYWLKAGQHSLARSAMTEAVSQLRKGLDLLSSLPESKQRQQQELDLQIALGRALTATRGYAAPEVGRAYARARELCEKLDNKMQLILVMFGQYLYHGVGGSDELSTTIAREILDLGERWDDLRVKYIGHRSNVDVCFYLGELAASQAHAERALALYDRADRAWFSKLTNEDPYCVTLAFLSHGLLWRGYLDQSQKRRDQALAEARQSGYADTLALALAHASLGESFQRLAASLQQHTEDLIAISGKHGFPFWETIGTLLRGWCLATSERPGEGIQVIGDSLAAQRAMGVSSRFIGLHLIRLAEAYGLAGLPEEGLIHLADAAELLETTPCRAWDSHMHRVRGDLLRSTAAHSEAEDALRQALVTAQRQDAKFFELRAAVSLARLWHETGRRAEACDLLAPVYDRFTEGFDAPDVRDAKALLNQLSHPA